MRLLLDTNAFLWWAKNDPQLSTPARIAVADRANEIFLSSVSTWELAIKVAIGKMILNATVPVFVGSQILQYNFISLPINYDHTYQVETMTLHHKDPFDRLLIAQAMVENLVIVTSDSKFGPYGVATLW